MGLFGFLPTVTRCCFCTRNLKVASVLITVWCMFAGSHCISMCINPACEDMFSEENDSIVDVLNIFKWFFFIVTLLFISGTFAFLLGIFLAIPHREVIADVFIGSSLVWAVMALVFAFLQIVQYNFCECTNPSDIISCFLYSPCMVYFIIVGNSYREHMEEG